MKTFKTILVGLDLSPIDRDVIQYAEFIAKKFRTEKIYFLHVVKDLRIDNQIRKEGGLEPIDEHLTHRLNESVQTYFKDRSNFEIACQVVEGSPAKQILHWAEIKRSDLIVVGRKGSHSDTGTTPRQIARNSSCSILMVPSLSPLKCEKIVVPTDFSKHALGAMKLGIQMLKNADNPTIYTHHLYDIPGSGVRGLFAKKKLEPIVKQKALEEYNEFILKVDTKNVDISPTFDINRDRIGAPLAMGFVAKKKPDLVIIGSQGKTGIKRLFLGSFAEKFIDANKRYPLLVCKEIGEEEEEQIPNRSKSLSWAMPDLIEEKSN